MMTVHSIILGIIGAAGFIVIGVLIGIGVLGSYILLRKLLREE